MADWRYAAADVGIENVSSILSSEQQFIGFDLC